MRNRYLLLLLSLFIALTSFRSDKPAYQLFNAKGKQVKYKKLIKEASKANVIFFGELHNNPISHWLQLELSKDMFEMLDGQLILGAEMFEADNQILLSEYLNGQITRENFESEARLWRNYKTDIAPLVEFARENELEFVATNIPRRYASMVYRHGFEVLDTLSNEAKAWVAPLPVDYDPELPGYKNMLEMMAGHGSEPNLNFPKGQAIKDATMAWFIFKHMKDDKLFIHFNGSYHSDNYEGILWYLNRLKPNLNMLTIATVEAETSRKLREDKVGVADFVITVPPE